MHVIWDQHPSWPCLGSVKASWLQSCTKSPPCPYKEPSHLKHILTQGSKCHPVSRSNNTRALFRHDDPESRHWGIWTISGQMQWSDISCSKIDWKGLWKHQELLLVMTQCNERCVGSRPKMYRLQETALQLFTATQEQSQRHDYASALMRCGSFEAKFLYLVLVSKTNDYSKTPCNQHRAISPSPKVIYIRGCFGKFPIHFFSYIF